MKKAQGISINTIIIAAIALIVLVILVAVFAGRMGIWGQEIDKSTNIDCTAATVDGSPIAAKDCKAANIIVGNFKNVDTGEVCCKTGNP